MLSGLGIPSMGVYEGDYEYPIAGRFNRDYREIDKRLSVAEFQNVARPFVQSVDRIVFLFELPIQLIFWSAHLVRVAMTTRYLRGLDPNDAKDDSNPEFAEQSRSVFEKLKPHPEKTYYVGTEILSSLLDKGDPRPASAGEGVEAAFAAMTMNAYAALETLAADLWIEALNRHSSLARNWFEKNPDKQLPGTVLAGYGFNASASMGTILHETRRATFESWGDVRKAYEQAFKGELADAFEPWKPIHRAEKTRHLFAHRGGMVDRKFRDEMKDFPEYNFLVVGERLRLTGPVVRDHVDACIKCGVALLKSADAWALSQLGRKP
jgi:hypothetical protein